MTDARDYFDQARDAQPGLYERDGGSFVMVHAPAHTSPAEETWRLCETLRRWNISYDAFNLCWWLAGRMAL